jgi:hypothetical protein
LKESYITFVLPIGGQVFSYAQLVEIDKLLERNTRRHEIVIIAPFTGVISGNSDSLEFSGPVSIVFTALNANQNSALNAGLARSVGDFIVEWYGSTESLSDQTFSSLLGPTDFGIELVELEFANSRIVSKIFYKLVNSLRSSGVPVRKIVGRSYSRRALGQILNAVTIEPQFSILFAELSLPRKVVKTDISLAVKESLQYRTAQGVALLLKGSRFGTVVPLLLAAISTVFGVGVSIYATVLYLTVGKSPEGWTTLMIIIGLGQASILALLGLTWSRIDSIARGLSGKTDATAEVIVIPPKL